MRTALLVVDCQNDFTEGGALAVEGGDKICARVGEWIAEAGTHYDLIVASQDWHINPGEHFSETPDYVDTWPAHCVAGTDGAELDPELGEQAVAAFDDIVKKGQNSAAYSAFEGRNHLDVNLGNIFQANNIDAVHVVGIAASHCVRASAIDAVQGGYQTTVIADLTVGVTPETYQEGLTAVEYAGGWLATCEELLGLAPWNHTA